MATLTATASTGQSTYPAQNVHVGTNTIYGQYVTSASLAVGDVLYLARVPSGARVVDAWLDFGSVPSNVGTICADLGDSSSDTTYLDSATLADGTSRVLARATQGMGTRYLGTSTTSAFAIKATITEAGTTTNTMTVKWAITYKCDENPA